MAQDRRRAIAMGASAGGIEALSRVVHSLPRDLEAAVFVVLHIAPSGFSALPQILARAATLPVTAAADGDLVEDGRVYVCPPDVHMLVEDGRVQLTRGPRENGLRPAIDPLFRSVAREYGPAGIGVVLSGMLDDGTAGLRMIKALGGTAVVQDPEEALYPAMPASAIASLDVDRVVSSRRLGALLVELLDAPAAEAFHQVHPADRIHPPDPVELQPGDTQSKQRGGTSLTCPECGGVLFEHNDGDLVRFGCQVGHVYSPESLLDGQSTSLETSLWSALRSLEERADLLRRLSRLTSGAGAGRLRRRARDVDSQAGLVRDVATRLGRAAPDRELIDDEATT